jgi:prolyl-tRNA editing enzyme YbaK/EbsC (Cys-tRNA(Pro) deacylase)
MVESLEAAEGKHALRHKGGYRWVPVEFGTASPPGVEFSSHPVRFSTTGCRAAAKARGVPLGNELKSLVLTTCQGLVVAHLPGDRRLSLRCVKRQLAVRHASLASREQLQSLGLGPGTVSAVLDPVWSLEHAVCRSLLEKEFVTTNDGTRQGFFVFSPQTLLHAKSVRVGDFAQGAEASPFPAARLVDGRVRIRAW